ncbi:MAG TPA: hypothetical protein VJ722_06325 [Rhodanobacteraceae bacterium]|nr:hypothetical protein [Rhodanobacteraceae bacterium]
MSNPRNNPPEPPTDDDPREPDGGTSQEPMEDGAPSTQNTTNPTRKNK